MCHSCIIQSITTHISFPTTDFLFSVTHRTHPPVTMYKEADVYKEEALAGKQGQILFTVYVNTKCGITKMQQKEKVQPRFHGGIKYTTLVSSPLQTLTAPRYIHKTPSLMSDLIR